MLVAGPNEPRQIASAKALGRAPGGRVLMQVIIEAVLLASFGQHHRRRIGFLATFLGRFRDFGREARSGRRPRHTSERHSAFVARDYATRLARLAPRSRGRLRVE